MIRSRMSFGGCFLYRKPTQEEIDRRKADHLRYNGPDSESLLNLNLDKYEYFPISVDDAIAYLEEKPEEWRSIRVDLSAVYTPDPTNPNSSWARATPSGSLSLCIQNPRALRGFKDQVAKAESIGRKNGAHPTKEFYVDIYAAPAVD